MYVENKSETVISFIPTPLSYATVWLDANGNVVDKIGKGIYYQYRPVIEITMPEITQLNVGDTIEVPKSFSYPGNQIVKNKADLVFSSSNTAVATV